MAPQHPAKYVAISPRSSIDLENDSDTTLASDSFLSNKGTLSSAKRISRYERSSKLTLILTWVRWGIVVFLQMIIIVILMPTDGGMSFPSVQSWLKGGWSIDKTETGGDVNGLYIPSKLFNR